MMCVCVWNVDDIIDDHYSIIMIIIDDIDISYYRIIHY